MLWTSGLCTLTNISVPIFVNWLRSRTEVCGPEPLIASTTPENGSPDLNVVSRMSPTLTHSLWVLSNSRLRAPVGSSSDSCCESISATGFLHVCASEGTDGWMIISRFSVDEGHRSALAQDDMKLSGILLKSGRILGLN